MFNGWILVDFYTGNTTIVIKIYLFPLSQKLHTCWELWHRMFFCQDRLWDLLSAFPTNYKKKTWDCEWRFINHPWWAQDWKRVPNILDSQCQKLNSPGKTDAFQASWLCLEPLKCFMCFKTFVCTTWRKYKQYSGGETTCEKLSTLLKLTRLIDGYRVWNKGLWCIIIVPFLVNECSEKEAALPTRSPWFSHWSQWCLWVDLVDMMLTGC